MSDSSETGSPRWLCRSCRGGFPDPIKQAGSWRCPWCAEPIAKYAGEYGAREIERMVRSNGA